MDFIELCQKRFSVRKFSDKKIEKEKIDLILNAGKLAPTAVNFQPQRILVVESNDGIEKLRNCTRYHFFAPTAIVVCYDKSVSWKRPFDGQDIGEVDASIVATHMMLEVANLGLGTTWVGYFDPQVVRKEFDLSENIVPVAIFPIGYPADDCPESPRHNERLDISETVKFV